MRTGIAVHETNREQESAMNGNPNHRSSRKEKQMNAITKGTSVAVLVTLSLVLAAGAAEPPKSESSAGAARGAEPAAGPPAVGGPLLAEALRGPLAGVEEIVFGITMQFPRKYDPVGKVRCSAGAQLCKLNLRTGKVTVLLDDPKGDLRDIQVHYDGKKAIFAYGKGGAPGMHLYEIGLDGTGLTRLTPEDSQIDSSPTYLPSDDIVFASTRSHRFVACAGSYAQTLFRCRPDGSRIFPISGSLENERGASVLADGRIIFLHWEYYHRGTHFFASLFTSNPDGTGVAAAFGNMHSTAVTLKAGNWHSDWPRQAPDSDRVCVVDRFNDQSSGIVAWIDPNRGPDDPRALQRVPGSPQDALNPDLLSPTSKPRPPSEASPHDALDPHPLGGDWILTSTPDGISLLDGKGRGERIYSRAASSLPGKGFWVVAPSPIRSRPREPVIPDRVDLAATTGKFLLADVNQGRNMPGVKPGEVKRLLVLEWLPTPSMYMPTARAAFFLLRIHGMVPVEADGSAYFEAPAGRAYAFVPLDTKGLSVKHMQSAAHLMPGEVAGCVGCHEPKTQAFSGRRPVAAAVRPPSRIQPYEGIPDRLDYLEDLQPIWDRHCVKCHNPDKREGGVLMTGERGGGVTPHTLGMPHSHLSLTAAGQIVDCRGPNQWGNLAPRRMGSGASALMQKLDGSHHDVKVSAREWATVALWLDTMVPLSRYYGEQDYRWIYGLQARGFQVGEVKAALKPSAEAMGVIERRCFTCHERRKPHRSRIGGAVLPGYRDGEEGKNYLFYPEPGPSPENDVFFSPKHMSSTQPEYDAQWREAFSRNESQLRRGSAIIVNWDRPEKSLVLLAPLAKPAGGYATASEAEVKAGKVKACPVLFQNTDDPDYKAILAGLPRVPAIKPETRMRPLRTFNVFGVLPPGPPDKLGTFDKESLWSAYWESLWWKPLTTAN